MLLVLDLSAMLDLLEMVFQTLVEVVVELEELMHQEQEKVVLVL